MKIIRSLSYPITGRARIIGSNIVSRLPVLSSSEVRVLANFFNCTRKTESFQESKKENHLSALKKTWN